jgi:hypothetical protein
MLMPWEEARGLRLSDAYARKPDARSVGILIGPEAASRRRKRASLRGGRGFHHAGAENPPG